MAEEQELIEQRVPLARGAAILFLMGLTSGQWQVWLNQIQDFDGVILAHRGTRAEAIEQAIAVLLEAVRALRELNGPGLKMSEIGGP